MKTSQRLLAIVPCLAVGLAAAARAENWPCFRGPTRQGISTETGLPLTWSAAENVAWRTPIPGEAWSSPIVWADRVFLSTAAEEGASCRLLALDRRTGAVLWDREVHRQVAGHRESRNSYATPTPCTDGERVYAVFADGSFVATDFEGRVLWTNRDFPFYSQHGLGTSPILWDGLLIMARDGSSEAEPKSLGWQKPWDRSFVLALDAATGQVRWKTGRGMSRIAHVVPNLWTAPSGAVQVVSGAGDVVQGFDARTGKLLWTSTNPGEGVVPSIVIGDGVAFTASGFSGVQSIRAFRLGGEGDLGETNLVWEQGRYMPHIPSFVYVRPHLFTISESGMAMCLDAGTGEIVWRERVNGTYSASPVAAEGRIYLLADDGETTVVEAAPAFRVLARNPLGEKCQASMAVSGGQLLIRAVGGLYCIGSGAAASP